MGEQINKQFAEYQDFLKKKSKRIKYVTSFNMSSELNDEIDELKNKDVIL